jgi:hypothetical protein
MKIEGDFKIKGYKYEQCFQNDGSVSFAYRYFGL